MKFFPKGFKPNKEELPFFSLNRCFLYCTSLWEKYPKGSISHLKKSQFGMAFLESKMNNSNIYYELFSFIHSEGIPAKYAKEIVAIYNSSVNCGGYALGFYGCIFSSHNMELEKAVNQLLSHFGDFIRVVSEKNEIHSDEYIVYYRCGEGHHFVKEQNGILTHKDACGEIEPFDGNWGNLSNCHLVIFAVKKEHRRNLKTVIIK